jgi:hypothetical protein
MQFSIATLKLLITTATGTLLRQLLQCCCTCSLSTVWEVLHTRTAAYGACALSSALTLLLLLCYCSYTTNYYAQTTQLSVARLQEGRLTAGERGALEGRLCAAQSESHALAADVLRLTEATANEAELRATAEDTAAQATAKVAELTAKVLSLLELLSLLLLLLLPYGCHCYLCDNVYVCVSMPAVRVVEHCAYTPVVHAITMSQQNCHAY